MDLEPCLEPAPELSLSSPSSLPSGNLDLVLSMVDSWGSTSTGAELAESRYFDTASQTHTHWIDFLGTEDRTAESWALWLLQFQLFVRVNFHLHLTLGHPGHPVITQIPFLTTLLLVLCLCS